MSSFCKSYSHFFSNNISIYSVFNDQRFNDTLTNDIVSFEQLNDQRFNDTLTNDIVSFEQLGPDHYSNLYTVSIGFLKLSHVPPSTSRG